MTFNTVLAAQMSTPWKLRFWMMRHLPMGWLTGMYIRTLTPGHCEVVVPDRWWTRNPFGSLFWAVMGMAAELSTGMLLYAWSQDAEVRFILTGVEARFFKKAKGKSYYFCDAGTLIPPVIEVVLQNDESGEVLLPVTARDAKGQHLADFIFRWQLKKPTHGKPLF